MHESSDSLDEKDLDKMEGRPSNSVPTSFVTRQINWETEGEYSSLVCSVFLRGLTGNLDS